MCLVVLNDASEAVSFKERPNDADNTNYVMQIRLKTNIYWPNCKVQNLTASGKNAPQKPLWNIFWTRKTSAKKNLIQWRLEEAMWPKELQNKHRKKTQQLAWRQTGHAGSAICINMNTFYNLIADRQMMNVPRCGAGARLNENPDNGMCRCFLQRGGTRSCRDVISCWHEWFTCGSCDAWFMQN